MKEERYIFIDIKEGIELIDIKSKSVLDDADKIKNTLNQQDDKINELEDSLRDANECLGQIYSHLGVEAFGKDIQEQAVKEIDRLMHYKRNKIFKNHCRSYDRKK